MPLLHHCGAGEAVHPLGFVIGCGGAGCNALHCLPHLQRFEPVAVNDMPSTAMAGIARHLLVPRWKLRGLAEVDDTVMRELRSDEEKKLAEFLGSPDLVFVMAGLGGEMGSWGSNVAVRVTNRLGATSFAIVNTPFSVEGPTRRANAAEALKLLQSRVDGLATFPNDGISKIAANLPLAKTFDVLGHFMAQPIAMLSAILTLTDLRILRPSLRKAAYLRFGAGESSALDGPETLALETALRSPWFDMPVETAQVAVMVVEADLAPRQVEALAKTVTGRMPQADLFLGMVPRPGREVSVRLLLGFY